jgi:ABC-type branched-subunit amino acid transport system substrate-binding protein
MTRNWLQLSAAALIGAALAIGPAAAQKKYSPGASDKEIKIGQTNPYSGPASAYASNGKTEAAYFAMLNDQGGINGRKINLISLDDGYVPPRTVEQTRRLVEQDQVAAIFGSLGTATQTAVVRYLNERKVPQLFLGSGAYKWGNYKETPWTMGGVQATFRAEARIYARYALDKNPNAKICILYQNDDFGRDYQAGVKDVLGDKYATAVKEASYEFTDPTIDSQIVTLQGSGCDTLIVAASPKFAAQSIRKVYDIGWKPMFFMTNVGIWVGSVMEPAGFEKGIGLLSSAYIKDPTDSSWDNDPAMKDWKAWAAKYMPDADARDSNYVNGYNYASAMVQVLRQAGNDLSRENIMRQAANLKNVELPMLLPGIKVNTSPTNYYPVQQMQLMRWSGKQWERFGDLLQAPPDR